MNIYLLVKWMNDVKFEEWWYVVVVFMYMDLKINFLKY